MAMKKTQPIKPGKPGKPGKPVRPGDKLNPLPTVGGKANKDKQIKNISLQIDKYKKANSKKGK